MAQSKQSSIEFNQQFEQALRLMEDSDSNAFITGRAGTGKSTLLQYFRDKTKKNIAILAPTGVAAVNVKGQTIHSFFKFRPNITPETVGKIRLRDKDIYKKLDTIVIDEISMVRADLLDCVDMFLRKYGRQKARPFGGIQMIFIGDLYQLPPVVTSREKDLFKELYNSPYFFSCRVFESDLFTSVTGRKKFEMEFIELEKVYRQEDGEFLNILNAIRNNTVTDMDITEINKRCDPEYKEISGALYIYLTTTNAVAENINIKKLAELKAQEHNYTGFIDGDFEARSLPTALDLTLKKGAQVMLLNNDTLGRWINGSIGRIRDIDEEEDGPDVLWVELADGDVVDVAPHEWEMYEYSYDKEASRVISESVGSFTQYPLRLAWAVTIHKSQGLTFERAIIDIGRGTFSHGQLYVALSRCTTMDGIILKKMIHKKHVLLDWRVVQFVTRYQYEKAAEKMSMEDRLTLIDRAIREKKKIEIVYLKAKDEKSKRIIIPSFVGELEYRGRKFPGVQAYCVNRKDERVFHLERILEMKFSE